MYSQYKIIDVLAKKAGGPYALSTVIIKRARQILKGKAHAFGQEKNNPIQESFEDFIQDAVAVSTGEDTAPEAQEGGKRSE
ncbi:MAG TPA: DNA-directed RNA polymerase subunit omega [Candidatus Brocadiia bacterium]|nr:DNA-directed RNA polymerase subunit omega [Planctomycetota bacterium]MBI4008235.1 DNA-directed RNA polymerase subunit omega [Planctomycetota bacterium]MDO8093327.1 DNA-directed RNA polymerase subunit omega [Candidatus Brocadiales bacterium]